MTHEMHLVVESEGTPICSAALQVDLALDDTYLMVTVPPFRVPALRSCGRVVTLKCVIGTVMGARIAFQPTAHLAEDCYEGNLLNFHGVTVATELDEMGLMVANNLGLNQCQRS